MSQSKVVSIGGVDYDSHTGMPVTANQAPVSSDVRRAQSVSAKGIHKQHQRSSALNRQFVKKSTTPTNQAAKPSTRSMDMRPKVKRSPHISKFAHEVHAAPAQMPRQTPPRPASHPMEVKARSVVAKQPAAAAAPAPQAIKHAELGKALANAQANTSTVKQPKRRSKSFKVAIASLGIFIVTGYFTYINLPNLSVKVAASQAGIDAKFPEYRPVGYHLNGPVGYQSGEVSMNFSSNSGPVEFSLNQARSNWDSSALLEKYVDPRSSGKYATYNDAGLTIYTYGTNAAWVNGGILYTVEGDASLSNEQIRRIATSM